MAITVKFRGQREIADAIRGLSDSAERAARSAIEEAGDSVLREVRARASSHRRTGQMESEILAKTVATEDGVTVEIEPAFRRAKYVRHVVKGTSPHGGHPGTTGDDFISAAAGSAGGPALARAEAKVSDAVAAYWRTKGGA